MKLCLASGNAHKAQEFQSLVNAGALCGVLTISSAREVCGMPNVDEDAGTFVGNARKKAYMLLEKLDAATRPGEWWVMADDSGLCVDVLGGEPGVESAYYAGPQGDGAANLAKLAVVMRDVPEGKRAAHFMCVLVLVSPEGEEYIFEGRCDGRLAREPRGGGGFGYDPIFVANGFDQTLSELGDEVKNTLSHRGLAWAKAETFLKQYLATHSTDTHG